METATAVQAWRAETLVSVRAVRTGKTGVACTLASVRLAVAMITAYYRVAGIGPNALAGHAARASHAANRCRPLAQVWR